MSTKKGICCLGEIVAGLAILFVAVFVIKAAGKSKKIDEELADSAPEEAAAPSAEASGKTDIGI